MGHHDRCLALDVPHLPKEESVNGEEIVAKPLQPAAKSTAFAS
mgnify:CR=1 FL=1